MADPIEILFTDGITGDSVCLFARWGIYSGEDALFLALKDHKDRWDEMDILAHSTMRHIYDLINDGEDLNYGISALPGRCSEQIHVDFKSQIIRRVTVDYSEDIANQATIHSAWTFRDFYNTHLKVSGEGAALLHKQFGIFDD